MSNSYKSKVIHLRSKDGTAQRVSPHDKTNWKITLNEPIIPDMEEHLVVSVNSAQIPFSFFTINANSKVVRLDCKDVFSGVYQGYVSINLIEGNYNANELLTELKTQLATYAGGTFVNGDLDWSNSSYNSKTNKFSLSVIPSAQGIAGGNVGDNTRRVSQYRIDWAYANACWKGSGFNNTDVVESNDDDDNATNKTTTSNTSVNVAGEEAVYIRAQGLSSVNSYESRHNGHSDILCKLPNQVGFYGVIHYEATAQSFKSTLGNGVPIYEFHIRLTDSDGSDVDTNGMDWELTLLVETIHTEKIRVQTRFYGGHQP